MRLAQPASLEEDRAHAVIDLSNHRGVFFFFSRSRIRILVARRPTTRSHMEKERTHEHDWRNISLTLTRPFTSTSPVG